MTDDVRVTRVGDGQAANAEVLTAGSAEVDVGSGVVVDAGLGEHGVVLNLGLLEGRAVGGNDHQPGCEGSRGWAGNREYVNASCSCTMTFVGDSSFKKRRQEQAFA